VCGFFTYGEFFTAEGRFELLNETMTLLSLSERPAADRPRSVSEEFSEGVEGANEIVQAMTHMVNTMAQEWEERLKRETEKNLEHERRISHQNKLAQMGEMVAMIAHQWRQPLNALSATAINLTLKAQMEELHPEDTLRGARFIQNQCQKMSQTIETFMEFVKPSREPRPFELRHSIDAVLVLIERQLYNHNVSVQVEERRTGVVIEGYEDQFEQVLLNLLANARDAFDESDRPDKQLTLIIDSDSRGLALLALEDNAGGIPEPLREKIFNPFFTSKEEGKGTGLGLYMSLEIIRKSFHSDLRYLPREGGSRFEIVFDPSVVRR
jgi:C4-dicarboxylate-specific signal transduction histidine kinase